jgi:hypothetical protein
MTGYTAASEKGYAEVAMGVGEITKQIAKEALLNATRDPAPTPAAIVPAPAPDISGTAMLAQIAAMQKALKEDEELVVYVSAAGEKLRVVEIFLPAPAVAVVSGVDANRALTRVVTAVAALQLVCRTAKVAAGAKPARIGLINPKSKDSNS